jgi:hypothetical protein
MPNQLDGIGVPLEKIPASKCPICEKDKHETTTEKKNDEGDLSSKPANLGCVPLVRTNTKLPNYTTAAHHLIPANQCLKAFPRLSQMCKAVGYDVNNSQNGMSLPTVGQKNKNVYGDDDVKYSKLKDADKKKVAYLVMEGTDLQWHVGHHNWVALNTDTDGFAHPANYDRLVKLKLRDMEKKFKKQGASICDPNKKEKGKEVITELNAESQRIKGKVESWKKYYVSAMANAFAEDYK